MPLVLFKASLKPPPHAFNRCRDMNAAEQRTVVEPEKKGTGESTPYGTHAISLLRRRLWGYGHLKVVRHPRWQRRWQKLRRSVVRRVVLPFVRIEPPFDIEAWSGIRLRLDPRNNTTDRQALVSEKPWTSEDEAAIQRAIASVPDERFVYVDVGANVGIYAAFVASLAREAHVGFVPLCIEPQPILVERLKVNLAFAGVDADAVRAVGTGPKDAVVPMDVSASVNLGKSSMLAERVANARSIIEVPCRPLAALVAEAALPRIDLMKVDIEGLEVPTLSAFFSDVSERLFPRTILIEVAHDRNGAIDALLLEQGYRRTYVDPLDAIYERRPAFVDPS